MSQEAIISWVEDHYWDSLEGQKDLILKHLKQCPALLESDPELIYECPKCKRFYQKEVICSYCKDVVTLSAKSKDIIDNLQSQISNLKSENDRLTASLRLSEQENENLELRIKELEQEATP